MNTELRPPQPDGPRELLTVDEFAAEARIGKSLAYELARSGQIPVVRFGRLIRIPRSALGVEK